MITALAARQHGVVSRAQLLDAGVPLHTIDHRVRSGRLHVLHPGVYRVGLLAAACEREMAAVLACGESAVLSHRSAAALWNLLPPRVDDAPVEVSVRRGYRARGSAVWVHRVRSFHADEATLLDGIPITTPARTVMDLTVCVSERELEQALTQADRDGLASPEQIATLLARYPRRPGTRVLRGLLAREGGPAFCRSEAESRFLDLVRRGRLRAPEANVVVEGHEVDFLWRVERLVVEIDGFAYHSSSGAFERDRSRDAVLTAAGFRVMRGTWRQLSKDPLAFLVRVAQALVRKGGA